MKKEKIAEANDFERENGLSPFDELVCKEIFKYIDDNLAKLVDWLKEKFQYFTKEKLEEIKNNLEEMKAIEGRRYFFEENWWLGLEVYKAKQDENHEFHLILDALKSNKTENLMNFIGRFLNRLKEDNTGFWLILYGYLHKFYMQVCTQLILKQDYEMLQYADKQLVAYASINALEINPDISDWQYATKIWPEEKKYEVSNAVTMIKGLAYQKLNSLPVQNVISAAICLYENESNSTKNLRPSSEKSMGSKKKRKKHQKPSPERTSIPLSRKAIKANYKKSVIPWDSIFKNEKINGLYETRTSSPNSKKNVFYDEEKLRQWLISKGYYSKEELEELGKSVISENKKKDKGLSTSYLSYKQ